MRAPFLLVLTASAAAQSLSSFGASCRQAQPVTLSGYGSPTPTHTVELVLQGAAPGAPHALLVGLSDRVWAGGSLPWPLPPGLGFGPGCALRVSPDVVLPLGVDRDGGAVVPLVVTPEQVGADLYLQAFGVAPSEPSYTTNGVHVQTAAAPLVRVGGRVVRRSDQAPVATARVTLFAPGLSTFRETRSDATGTYADAGVSPGTYRLGVAAPGYAYVEVDQVVGTSGANRDFPLDPETHPGRWDVAGNTNPEPLDATDIVFLLPDGWLFYCHDTEDPILFDPVSGAKVLPAGSGSDQGCTNGTLLEDGALIQVGGQEGPDFRNATRMVKSWSRAAGWLRLQDLLHPRGRWYPGLARLSDGTLLVMGGGQRPDASRTNTCELFDQSTRTWRTTGSMGQAVEYPPAGLLHDGRVLRTWGSPEVYDPATGSWAPTGSFVAPARGWPGHSDHSLVILTGGEPRVIGILPSLGAAGAAMVEAFDVTTGAWSAKSSPALKRMQTEVTYLPDGNILVSGGEASLPAPVPDRFGIVKWTDLYDPRAETWRRVGDRPEFAEYHAVTALVPDGRVLTTGGTTIKFRIGPTTNDIFAYSPPYLFRGVRPRLSNLSASVLPRGATLAFDVFPTTRITRVVLMGTTVHTHWVEGGVPRRLELPVVQAGARVQTTLPTDANLLPVGHYLVFAMVDDIPSVAAIVRVRG